ncbi:hypothetical protein SAMN05192574_102285 [Mucilaginibacter gossypiicola]|uniref:Uncharacterized protein n=1 Tax=Mucilaginibacter gossypiicola TaxID=551995 RepID=A0A1H8DBQ8_9SPHI|nr:hypothetical protein SAMN05192574_102285 [Mucilaginibacter gossypiicola]
MTWSKSVKPDGTPDRRKDVDPPNARRFYFAQLQNVNPFFCISASDILPLLLTVTQSAAFQILQLS